MSYVREGENQRSSIGILPADTAPCECVLATGIAPQSEENLNAWQTATILQSPAVVALVILFVAS